MKTAQPNSSSTRNYVTWITIPAFRAKNWKPSTPIFCIYTRSLRKTPALSFALIPVSALILWDFYLLLTNPAYAFYTSKDINIAEIIALLIHIGALLLHAAFIAFSVSDGFYLGFLRRQKETVEELLNINEVK